MLIYTCTTMILFQPSIIRPFYRSIGTHSKGERQTKILFVCMTSIYRYELRTTSLIWMTGKKLIWLNECKLYFFVVMLPNINKQNRKKLKNLLINYLKLTKIYFDYFCMSYTFLCALHLCNWPTQQLYKVQFTLALYL